MQAKWQSAIGRCRKMWQSSLGRFSQIWLQTIYEHKHFFCYPFRNFLGAKNRNQKGIVGQNTPVFLFKLYQISRFFKMKTFGLCC